MADSGAEAAQARKQRREAILLAAGRERRRTRTRLMALGFGFLAPAFCFPLYWSFGFDIFGRFSFAVHVGATLGIGLLGLQVSGLVKEPRRSALLAGALASAASHALLIGLALSPVSILLLLWVIGLVGLLPFGTAWTLVRAAREVWENSAPLPAPMRSRLGVLGFMLAAAVPVGQPVVQELAFRVALERIDSTAPDAIERANDVLRWVPWLSSRPLCDEAAMESDEARFERLSQLYELRFGRSIEEELWAD